MAVQESSITNNKDNNNNDNNNNVTYGNRNNNVSIQYIFILYELSGATTLIIKYTSKIILNSLEESFHDLLNLQITYQIATNKSYRNYTMGIEKLK